MNDFKDKVVYQIYPKSFMDSNGDGFGDLKGVTAKLDYLADLGVDYLWLTPFFPSPQRDNGYDVADYRAVDPRYGTMEDLEELIREADRRGIGLMLDMVFNHTSTEHEWFKKALAGDKKYQDYYIFKDGTPDCYPTNWVSKFGGPAWEYVPCLGKWYLHLYDVMQADLNWENPAVREEMADILRFWKAKGIKGFRFDVINVISKPKFYENDYEGDGRRFYTDGRNVHKYLKELVAAGGIDGMITVGEMSSTTLENCIGYTAEGNHELTMCFNFHHLKVDYKDGQKWELREPDYLAMKKLFQTWQEGMQAHGGWNALFWCNHDQPRAVSRFGSDTTYWKESAEMLAVAIHFMRAGISGSFRVVFGAIFGFVYAPLVITGLHHMSNAIDMQLIADFGGTMLWPMIALSNIAQGSAVLGMIYLQRKNADAQEVNVPSCISCYLGVTEPAMFGVNLKFHFPFICGMIGSAIAAAVCVATSTTANAIGVGGIPGILSIQPAYMLSFALCMVIAIVVPFVLTVSVGKKKGIA